MISQKYSCFNLGNTCAVLGVIKRNTDGAVNIHNFFEKLPKQIMRNLDDDWIAGWEVTNEM